MVLIRTLKLLALVAGIALLGSLAVSAAAQEIPTSEADVPASLAPPASSVPLFALAARGEQIYVCQTDPDDASAFVWTLTAPDAELLNAQGDVVGRHFAGPTWQGQDGSAVVGAVLERADAPAAGAIPWLLLEANSHEGSGAFSTITHIQRLDTVGGVAPAEPGVYRWEGLALGDYAIGGSGEMPADLAGLRVTDASGAALQNPVLSLTAAVPDAEYHYLYFRAE